MLTNTSPAKFACSFFLAVLLLSACKKESTEVPEPNVPTGADIILSFSGNSIGIQNVDSAEVILQKAGGPAIKKSLEKYGPKMAASMQGLPAGEYNLEWRVYTKGMPTTGNMGRQFVCNGALSLPLAQAKEQTAPAGDWQGNWLPRIHTRDIVSGLLLTLPMDFTDPYFSISFPAAKHYDYIYVDRIAKMVNGAQSSVVGQDAYDNMDVPQPVVIENRDAFARLAQTMQNRQWNRGEILVIVKEKNGVEKIFFSLYNKP